MPGCLRSLRGVLLPCDIDLWRCRYRAGEVCQHPAVFPDQIPYDFIQCFCPPKGIVLDPFVGCGSTAVSAKQLGRFYLGFDISEEYCNLALKRLNRTQESLIIT